MASITRYVCPPWFECRCSIGKPVSRTTMLAHRRKDNKRRSDTRRGSFRWGPRVPTGVHGFIFDLHDSLSEHPSDQEAVDEEEQTIVEDEEPPFHSAQNEGTLLADVSVDDTQPSTGIAQSGDVEATAENYDAMEEDINVDGGHHERDEEDGISEGEMGMEPEEGSSEEGLETNNCRVPGLTKWLWTNRKWVELFQKHGLKVTVMDDILKNISGPSKTWKTVVNNIIRASGLSKTLQVYSVCPGNMLFVDLATEEEMGVDGTVCSECTSKAPSSLKEAEHVFRSIPLLPRFQAMMLDKELCDRLYKYRREGCISAQDIFADYFDGAAYQELLSRFGGEEAVQNDIFISGSADGFQVFQNKSDDVWLIAALNFNISRSERYLIRNMIPLGFVPGPNQPTNLQSFLIPLINEVLRSQQEPFQVRFHDGVVRPIRIHLIYFSGDQQAICKFSGLVGYNGRMPCRDCLIEGVYAGHYYYPSRIMEDGILHECFDMRALPRRSVQQSNEMILQLKQLTGTARKDYQKNTGISTGSVLFCLSGIDPYSAFPQDIMHTFQNIQRELLRIMIFRDYNDDFSLTSQTVRAMDEELKYWRDGISGELAPSPRPLSKFSTWKAAELKQFTLSYCLILFDGRIPPAYLDGLKLYVDIVELCSAPIISRADISRLRRTAVHFVDHFERMYFHFLPERVNMCKSIFHALLHLADCTERFGPLSGISQFWVERKIGWVGDRLNARTRAGESLLRSALFGEAFKIFYKQPFAEESKQYAEQFQAGGLVFLGPFSVRKLADLHVQDPNIRSRLVSYLKRKYDDMDSGDAWRIVGRVERVTLYSRLRSVCGSGVVTGGAYWNLTGENERKPGYRARHFVAAEMDATDETADVYYGRIRRIIEVDLQGFDDMGMQRTEWACLHRLVYMDWASRLMLGGQGQVFKDCRAVNAFSGATIEDASVVTRPLGVVEHLLPTRSTATSTAGGDASVHGGIERGRRRTYFIDNNLRTDKLLSANASSPDKINRRLKGLAPRR